MNTNIQKTPLEYHEELCEERYNTINFRLARLEKYAIKAVIGLISLLVAIIGLLLKISLKLN